MGAISSAAAAAATDEGERKEMGNGEKGLNINAKANMILELNKI